MSSVTQCAPPSSTADASGNGNTGTLLVDASVVAGGQTGGALRVGGQGGAVNVADSTSLVLADADFTIEAWVYPEPATDEWGNLLLRGPIVLGPGYQLGLSTPYGYNASVCLSVWSDGWLSTMSLSGGSVSSWQWSHIVAQRTGNTLRLFVNDYEAGSAAFSGSLCTSPGPVRFGSADPMVDCFKGLIDEVRITAVPRFPPATSTADASGNGNDGALRGTAAIVTGGQTGGALRVGGQGSGAEVPASEGLVLGASDFLIEAWVRPELNEYGNPSGGRVLAGPGFELSLWLSGGPPPYYGGYYLSPSACVSGDSGTVNPHGYGAVPVGEWTPSPGDPHGRHGAALGGQGRG